MAKRRKSKGKRRGGKRKGKKRGHKQAKHSLALEGAVVWDGYKFVTADFGGQTVGHRLMGAVADKAQRGAISADIKSGAMTERILGNTREVQMVALFKVAQKMPLVKGPANAVANALNQLGRTLGIKGKYKVV